MTHFGNLMQYKSMQMWKTKNQSYQRVIALLLSYRKQLPHYLISALEGQKVKTVSVRIKAGQAERLREVAERIPGSSINVLVQRAVAQWLDIEAPVYIAAFDEARAKLERQPVRSEGVSR
jgi:hypothetical protein